MMSPVTASLLDPGVEEYIAPEAQSPITIRFDGTQVVSAEDRS